ncbi:MAG: hypothetical protein CM15mP59_0450 [Flavobacteriaceae bacterium]|nr:MAG: hypothetical protein CM15mP59_0450 [Flavobacteriaceae bacterium]
MIGAGLDDGDLLVIDRSLEPQDGKIAVCLIDGDLQSSDSKSKRTVYGLWPKTNAKTHTSHRRKRAYDLGLLPMCLRRFDHNSLVHYCLIKKQSAKVNT